ncbi:hypothetical protein C485_18112 [Natrinema altunense JCM 12890]|uniref:Uncharacterized protein n=1 Tax=Natrinema altunense (strain JCM 12890 / CGMCC 1.3731 / AJ2) TaxID=1227494 RepID=L9ZES4_NATA2|nr:hypothetical protein C485_18112 [Natrinema altunense JCM 12890]
MIESEENSSNTGYIILDENALISWFDRWIATRPTIGNHSDLFKIVFPGSIYILDVLRLLNIAFQSKSERFPDRLVNNLPNAIHSLIVQIKEYYERTIIAALASFGLDHSWNVVVLIRYNP